MVWFSKAEFRRKDTFYSENIIQYQSDRTLVFKIYLLKMLTSYTFTTQCSGSGSGIRCLFDPWIRDPRWVKNQNPESGSRSRINIPDHISESSETIFWVKNALILWCGSWSGIRNLLDPGSGVEKFWSGTNILDPQHCKESTIKSCLQCCGSGSRIRVPVPFWPLDPDPGSGIGFFRIPDLGSQTHIFASFLKNFW